MNESTRPRAELKAALPDVYDVYEYDDAKPAGHAYSAYALKNFDSVKVSQIANATRVGIEVTKPIILPEEFDQLDVKGARELIDELQHAIAFIETLERVER